VLRLKVALALPAKFGVYMTEMEQLAPAARLLPQLSVSTNGAIVEFGFMGNEAVIDMAQALPSLPGW
jgi:hypothetical protein